MYGRIKYLNPGEKYGYLSATAPAPRDYAFYPVSWEGLAVGDAVSFDLRESKSGQLYAVNVALCAERNQSKYHTEDKQSWCREGARLEEEFVENVVPLIGRRLVINPEKIYNPRAIDLQDLDRGRYADLKSQNTPFFTAASVDPRYDPRFTVTFNRKDYLHYARKYPLCDIYFCVNWTQTSYQNIQIEPLEGVWVSRFPDMRKLIEDGLVPLHPYKYRKGDAVNARDSYLFDLNHPVFTCLLCRYSQHT